jgi:hypothetical protein
MGGAITPGALAAVIGRVSFEIIGEKGHYYSDSLKTEMVG